MKSSGTNPLWLSLGLLFCMLLLSNADAASHTASAHPILTYSAAQPTTGLLKDPTSPIDAQPTAVALHAVVWDWRAWQLLPPALQAKVDVRILAELRGEVLPAYLGGTATSLLQARPAQPGAQTRFLVYLDQQPDLHQWQDLVFASQVAQRNAIVQTLLAQTQAEQADLRAYLNNRQRGTPNGYQPFFLVNALAVEGGLDLILELVQRADVVRLVANYPLQPLAEPTTAAAASGQAGAESSAATLDDENWNITLLRADRVWQELGIRGEGAVVAGFDTGVNFRHPALINRYRGNLGNGRFDHNYNWFEPDGNLYPSGDLGPSLSREPTNCGSHGTHTMGTMVGDGGVRGTQVGMAPGATWIALPGICGGTMNGGIRDDIGGIKAFQWLLCPTDLSGALATADCSRAPDVVNNSWGAANPVGDIFRPMIQALRVANIAPVFAAGNPRAADGSIGSPGNAPEALTVGATDRNDLVASFSGRGPSFYSGEQKPELSAPGVDIKSAVSGNSYERSSGTSMAAPHVAGLIALMVAADLRDGTRDFSVDELERFLQLTAVDLGTPGADNDYGFGRVDAYAAVQWVLSAGDLRGTVRDAKSSVPLAAAHVVGEGRARFTATANIQGVYSLTVPADVYQLQVGAWGYLTSTFANQFVVADALSVADFALEPLARLQLQGTVRSGGLPLPDLQIRVAAAPEISTTTDANGQYSLSLPSGTHTLLLEKAGYRQTAVAVTVATDRAPSADFTLLPAPTILLIEADAYRGWFAGWPIGEFFRSALADQGYLADRWPLQYTDRVDRFIRDDGSIGYGIPSLATLASYDLVIWAQSGCNSGLQGCFYANAPTPLGASAILQAYMDQGGRLILSGQDLGFWEEGTALYTDYLHAALVDDGVGSEGSTLSGQGFLDGIQLTLTNASLYGYANGSIQLAPDAVRATEQATIVYPILTYDENQLPAALAIAPCDATYRAVYFAVGYENISQRGTARDPAIAATLGRSVDWVTGARLAQDFALLTDKPLRFGAAGEEVRYPLQLINTGRQPLDLQLTAGGARWSTTLLQGTTPIDGPLHLAPCQSLALTAVVDAPADAPTDTRDELTLTAVATSSAAPTAPPLSHALQLITGVFAQWQSSPVLPTARYQLSGAMVPGTPGAQPAFFHTVGGWIKGATATDPTRGDVASAVHERFDSCQQRWQRLADLPEPRAGAAIATLDGYLYAVGGATQSLLVGNRTVQPHANLWRYDPTANRWQALAPLPVALTGATAVGIGESLYLFGGVNGAGVLANHTYHYHVNTDEWTAGRAIPGPGRAFAAATAIGDRVALVGGYPALNLVHIYDPVLNQWQEGPPLQQGRHSFGLTSTPTGALYVMGGAVGEQGIATVERLDITGAMSSAWRFMPELANTNRDGAAAAYVNGQLIVAGGADSQGDSEALAVGSAFCRSAISTPEAVVGLGNQILYTITLQPDGIALPATSFNNPLPVTTHFVEILGDAHGARYNATTHSIEWQGTLTAQRDPLAIRYAVTTDPAQLHSGERLTNTVTFASGYGLVFTRTATVALLSTDLAGSYKAVDQLAARSGDRLTYTVHLQGDSYISNSVTLRDPLPALLTYVPDSLSYENGSGGYDAATHSIWWQGDTTQRGEPFYNLTDRYLWGDSDGQGAFGAVTDRWVEIRETGNSLGGGDNEYSCDLPIGFPFPFYGQLEATFCVSTNGFLSFDSLGDAGDLYTYCPLSTLTSNRGLIAALWTDLVVTDAIYYQSFGTAPHRYLVVQWQGARRFSALDSRLTNFQILLSEDGSVRIAVGNAGALSGLNSTTGIAGQGAFRATTYACNRPGTLHDDLSIFFVPPGGTVGLAETAIQFQAQIAAASHQSTDEIAAVGVNLPLTNTVLITSTAPPLPAGVLSRSATTLINPLDLHASSLLVDQAELTPQTVATYRLLLQNRGLVSATTASLLVTLPAPLHYETESVTCDAGRCDAGAQIVEWHGAITPQQPIVVTFQARLAQALPDRTPLTVSAQLADGFGNAYPLSVTVLARRSDMSQSQLQFLPRYGEPGTTTLVVLLLQNVGKLATTVHAALRLPAQLSVVDDSLRCGTGSCTLGNGMVEWQGTVAPRELIPVQLMVQIPTTAAYGDSYAVTVTVDDLDWAESFTSQASFTVMHTYLLPMLFGAEAPYRRYLPLIAGN